MMDKIDMVLKKIEVMQSDINKLNDSVQTTINNQIKITNALNQNFKTIVNKQVELALVLTQSFKDVHSEK